MPQKIKSALQIIFFTILLLAGIGKVLRPTLDSRSAKDQVSQEAEGISTGEAPAVMALDDFTLGNMLISWVNSSEYWVSAELIVDGEPICGVWTPSDGGNIFMILRGRPMLDLHYIVYVSTKKPNHQASRDEYIHLSVDDRFHISMPADADSYDFDSNVHDIFLQYTVFSADLNHNPQVDRLRDALRQGSNVLVSVVKNSESSQFSLSGSNRSFESFTRCLDYDRPSDAIYFDPPIPFSDLGLGLQ